MRETQETPRRAKPVTARAMGRGARAKSERRAASIACRATDRFGRAAHRSTTPTAAVAQLARPVGRTAPLPVPSARASSAAICGGATERARQDWCVHRFRTRTWAATIAPPARRRRRTRARTDAAAATKCHQKKALARFLVRSNEPASPPPDSTQPRSREHDR